jgi:transcription elongation factor Elf1
MEPSSTTDIVFACSHCAAPYVVDVAAAGVTLQCQRCGNQTTVPSSEVTSGAASSVRVSELQHQLKENESQRTEITSYINQHSIQLHRWQLRLKDLSERQQKLQTELSSLSPSERAIAS